MEIKAILNKPYNSDEKIQFIIEQNHNRGYQLKETKDSLEAWGYTKEETEQFEKERIAQLSLSKREVFLAIYKDKGIPPYGIKEKITDLEELIEFEYATVYYRGNHLIDTVGKALGYTSEELDYLFENKKFNTTLSK